MRKKQSEIGGMSCGYHDPFQQRSVRDWTGVHESDDW